MEPAPSPSPPPPPLPSLGISLAGVHAFIAAQAGGRDALEGLTTAEVCTRVRAATAAGRTSLCEQLHARRSPDVGPATAYVVHAWGHAFLDVVDALGAWAARLPADDPPPRFWFDVFTMDQHAPPPARPSEWWGGALRRAVQGVRRTVLVLPWTTAGTPAHALRRAWCLAELLASLRRGVTLEVALSPREEAAFVRALEGNAPAAVAAMAGVDCAAAVAYHGGECGGGAAGGVCRDVAAGAIPRCPNDAARIRSFFKRDVGVEETDRRLSDRLRAWAAGMEAGAFERRARLQKDLPRARALFWRGRLLFGMGRFRDSEPLLRASAGLYRRRLGAGHPDTLAGTIFVANVLAQQGRLEAAERLARGALADSERQPRPDGDPRRLAALAALACVQMERGRLGDAEASARAALEGCTRALGEDHPDTLSCKDNLSVVLQRQGRLEEAEPLARAALEGRARALGRGDPDTLIAAANLAALLVGAGRLDEAGKLARPAADGLRDALGAEHPDTLAAAAGLAALLRARGSLAAAEAELTAVMEARRRVLGRQHPHTVAAMSDLVALLRQRGKDREAEPLARAILSARVLTLGAVQQQQQQQHGAASSRGRLAPWLCGRAAAAVAAPPSQ